MSLDSISALRNTPLTATVGKTSGSDFASVLSQAMGAAPKTAAQQLEDYVNMTPEQRMRADLLKKLGLTEEELAAMSPEQREAVEAKLKELVQQQMHKAAARQTARIHTQA